MHSRLLVSGLSRSLPPLPPSPALPCPPCVEGRQRAAPHSSFPPTTAPLQTLHIDVWGLAHVSGQGRERYFLLVVDDYMRYTTVFPLRSKGEVPHVLIPWIREVRLQLRKRFHEDLLVLHLHFERGGELSSDLLRDFCRGEGILQSFLLLASPQKNGIAERCIGLVMEVARTSMIHAAAPHFQWPFAVGNASVFRVWGSHAFVRDTFADKLSARAIPCVFLGFPLDAPGWQFYHPTSRCVLPSQDVTFDKSVPFYRLVPYRSAPLPSPPLFLASGPPPVDPLPPQGPTPSGVSQEDLLPGIVHVEVAVDSGASRGPTSGGAEPAGAGPGGAESEGAGSGGAEPGGDEPAGVDLGGAEHAGAEPGGPEPEGAELGGAESEGAESGGAELRGTASSGGPTGASPRLSPQPEPLSPQQLREWFARRTRLWSGAAGAGDTATGGTGAGGGGATSLGGAGVPARSGGPRGVGAGGAGGDRAGDPGTGSAGAGGFGASDPGGTGAARAGIAAGVGAGGFGVGAAGGSRAAGPRGACNGGTGAAGAGGAAGVGAGDTEAGGVGPGGAGAVGAGSGGTGQLRPYFVSLLQQVLWSPVFYWPYSSLTVSTA
ncbi:unnamed protein product [Closterium sp. NIES-54]